MPASHIELTLPSSLAAVEDSVATIVGWLSRSGAEHLARDLELAVGEAIGNAVVHGHGCDGSKAVHVTARRTPGGVELAVRDAGSGFDPTAVGDPTAAPNLCKPSGRGMFLIRHLVDRAEWITGASGTTVWMTRRL
jgi:anti-sigma regulatory factor (Ser/Thr protein kinase)